MWTLIRPASRLALKAWTLWVWSLWGVTACAPTSTPGISSLAAPSPWLECERDDRAVKCRYVSTDGGFALEWRDGELQRFTCEGECRPHGFQLDAQGGRWKHELFIQGNSRYTHVETGQSIFVPLRPPGPSP